MSANHSMADIISEMYDKMQMEKMISIDTMQAQIKEYENMDKSKSEIKRNFKTAMEVFDSIIKSEEMTNRQLNTIIDKIIVYDDGTIEINLKGELSSIFKDEIMVRMSKEDRIKRLMIDYMTNVSAFGMIKIINAIREHDSISYDTMKDILQQFIDKGYVVETNNKENRMPYVCVATKKDMLNGFNICTDLVSIYSICNVSTTLEIVSRISTWIQRYM